MDGSGYPNGLCEDEILLEAGILAVAVVLESMSSHRPYLPTMGMPPATEEIKNNRGTLYDTKLVGVCLEILNSGFEMI